MTLWKYVHTKLVDSSKVIIVKNEKGQIITNNYSDKEVIGNNIDRDKAVNNSEVISVSHSRYTITIIIK